MRQALQPNPILDFGIDRDSLDYVGRDLQRPECILAEPDGTLWSADARGGVVRLAPDGSQQIVTQRASGHFEGAGTEASRYLEGTLPNGLAFDQDGNFLISNFGTDCLELMTRDGASRVLADRIDGQADRQSQLRAARFAESDLDHRVDARQELDARAPHRSRRMAIWRATSAAPFASWPMASDSRTRSDSTPTRSSSTSSKPRAAASLGSGSTTTAMSAVARSSVRRGSGRARGRTASRSTASAISGARWCTRTSCSSSHRKAICGSCSTRAILKRWTPLERAFLANHVTADVLFAHGARRRALDGQCHLRRSRSSHPVHRIAQRPADSVLSRAHRRTAHGALAERRGH